MSIDIMNRLWWRSFAEIADEEFQALHPGSARNLKWTLVAMADMASDDGFCWPAIKTVAIKASLSPRAVQMAIRQAEAIGILRRRHRHDASTQYVFVLDTLPHVDRPQRSKEKGPIDHFEEPETDLFGRGAGPAPLPDSGVQGLHHPPAGDSLPPAQPAPRNVRETSNETPSRISGDLQSPAATLVEHIEARWQEIVDANEGRIAAIRKIDAGLKRTIEIRARQHARDGETDFQVWDELLENIATSRFLRGLVPPGPGRETSFRLSLPWACTASHFREIINGKYNQNRDESQFDPRTGRRLGPTDQALRGSLASLRAARERRDRG